MATQHGGRRANSGRKSDKDINELQAVLAEACPHEARVEAMRVLVAKAQASDVGALKLLFGYLYGTPVTRTEITGADGGPIESAEVGLTDEERRERVAALFDRARTRRTGQPA